MEQVTNPLAQSLADRFTAIAHMLRKTLGAPDYARFNLALKWAVWHRISFLSLRFRALALNPRPIRERKPQPKAQTAPEPAPTAPTGAKRSELPRQNGWLLQTFPGHHIPYVRGHLIRFLEDPDLSLLQAENPRIGRVLRPICHMLAIPLPDYLKLPRKPRQSAQKPEQKPARKPARRSEKPEPSFYEYMLAKYPAPPPRPTLPGHIYEPSARAKINFER
ncbi:hypothetical protein ACOSOMT5_P2037 [Acidiphilium sp. MT5]